MKRLSQFALLSILFLAFQTSSNGQASLKFINGIELEPQVLEYSQSTQPLSVVPVTTKKIPNRFNSSFSLATEACKALQFKYAQLLDLEIEGVSNFMMFGFIDEWLNIRYRYGGTTKKGIDCSALTGLLFGAVYGFALPRTAREQYQASERVSKENLQEGDLVFFNTRGGISHVGVYLANDRFVHASSSQGVTISDLNDQYYASKYIGAGRLPMEEPQMN